MGLFDQMFGGREPAPVADAQPVPVGPPQLPLGAQLNGLPPEVQAAPPKTPEEMQQRKSQWGVFLDQLKSDPNAQLSLLRLGTNMMQPIAPGQTAAGHLGRSLDDSVSYLGGLREAERARKNQERELTLKEQKGAADIAHTGAQTKSTEQTTSQSGQTFPTKLSALQLELKKLQREEGAWTPQQAARAIQLKNDLAQAQIDQAKAHAEAYKAIAGKNETTGRKVQSLKLDDGTVVTTTSDKTGTYYSRFVPPRFNSTEEAKAAAEKVVEKKTPWFLGKPGYEGTKEQEVARLVQQWTKPGVEHYDSAMKPIKELPPDPDAATGMGKANPALEKLVASPSQFDELFTAEETRLQLPPGSLKRLAATESSLNPAAVNGKDGNGGSYGLMQINGVHLKDGLTAETVMDPATNIRKGAEIYAAALKKAGGDQQRAAEIYKGATSAKGKASVAGATAFVGGGDGKPATGATPEIVKVERAADGSLKLPETKEQTPSGSFNEAGYSTVESTIAGAGRGDQKAKDLLRRMLDEGGLSAQEKVRIKKVL